MELGPPSPGLPSVRPRANGTSVCRLPSPSCRPASLRRSSMAPRLRTSRSAAAQSPETNAQDTHRMSAKESAEAVDSVPAAHDMELAGIKTPVGIKIHGPSLDGIEAPEAAAALVSRGYGRARDRGDDPRFQVILPGLGGRRNKLPRPSVEVLLLPKLVEKYILNFEGAVIGGCRTKQQS